MRRNEKARLARKAEYQQRTEFSCAGPIPDWLVDEIAATGSRLAGLCTLCGATDNLPIGTFQSGNQKRIGAPKGKTSLIVYEVCAA
jgi:hypothetical protein